jgi:uncharacterized protein (DUF488 family)
MATPSGFYTIGHSTRSVEELVDLLRYASVDFVVDVRSIPRSRTNPQFNSDTLPAALCAYQIGYSHLGELGGLRGRSKNNALSRNTYWVNKSFRNYADYAATQEFRAGMTKLLDLGRRHVCAIMCAEAVWWRCHRRIISDYLLAEGELVFHIMSLSKIEPASVNPAAILQPDGTLLYAKPVP